MQNGNGHTATDDESSLHPVNSVAFNHLKPSRFIDLQKLQIGAVLFTFVSACSRWFWNSGFSDLAPIYVGCKLLATKQNAHLYALDIHQFNVSDSVWIAEWHRNGYSYAPPPFVQTPLLPWTLQPACMNESFLWFAHAITVLSLACVAVILWMICSRWAPRLLAPVPMATICAVLASWDPFRYAFHLGQLHVLFFGLALCALILVDKTDGLVQPSWTRAAIAGLLLALATSVKITPGFLVLYWLARRQWRAISCFALSMLVLLEAARLIAGPTLMHSFWQTLQVMSNTVFVAYNNQSLAAWLVGSQVPREEIQQWHLIPLSMPLRLISTCLVASCCAFGGVMDLRIKRRSPDAAPYGAAFALCAATAFPSLSWSHYAVLLMIPFVLAVEATFDPANSIRLRISLVVVLIILELLNVRVWAAVGPHPFQVAGFTPRIVRPQFYSWLIALATMATLYGNVQRGRKQSMTV